MTSQIIMALCSHVQENKDAVLTWGWEDQTTDLDKRLVSLETSCEILLMSLCHA